MRDSLLVEEGMIVKFPLVCIATLQLLLQCSLQQEEVKQSHCRETQWPNIMNYQVTQKASEHLPLTLLPCLPEQCYHCGKNFSRKSSLSKHMFVVHGASRLSKTDTWPGLWYTEGSDLSSARLSSRLGLPLRST